MMLAMKTCPGVTRGHHGDLLGTLWHTYSQLESVADTLAAIDAITAATAQARQPHVDRLAILLNDFISNLPQQTGNDQRKITELVSHVCDRAGVWVACPNTSQPASVVVEDYATEKARYRFRINPDGESRRFSATRARFPSIHFLDKQASAHEHRIWSSSSARGDRRTR